VRDRCVPVMRQLCDLLAPVKTDQSVHEGRGLLSGDVFGGSLRLKSLQPFELSILSVRMQGGAASALSAETALKRFPALC
jgi:hypothetical protein